MNKYEKLIEHIINDETEKARALFHTIVVEKSRDIYESLIDEEDLNEVGCNEVDDLVDEVTCDEEGMNEEEDESEYGDTSDWAPDADSDKEGESDFDIDTDGDAGFGGEEGEGDIEDRVMDLESAFDELQARFDELMADEANEPEHNDGFEDPDFGGEESFGADDKGTQEFFEEEEWPKDEEDEEEDIEETLVREYVEKVGDTGQKTEGGEVGKGGTATIQKQNPLAKPNRMGGESFKLGQNGAKDPSGTTAQKGENNAYKKGQGELDLGKRNVNQPGGNKGAQNFYSKKEKASSAEGQTTDSKLSVNTKSVGGKIKR
jgi:hypothetical protein